MKKQTQVENIDEQATVNKTKEFVLNESSLIIKPWEAKYSHDLFIFITTPWAVKRFSNVYRILKASVGKERLSNFEGTVEMPGQFQIPMLLLAILTGAPSVATVIFPKLYQGFLSRKNIKEVWKELSVSEPLNKHSQIKQEISTIIDREWFPQAES